RRVGLHSACVQLLGGIGLRRRRDRIPVARRLERSFETRRRQRVEECAADRCIDLTSADPQTVFASAIGDRAPGAVVTWRGVASGIIDAESAAAASAARETLKQCRALSHGASGLVWTRMSILCEPCPIGFEGLPIDEPWVVIANEHRPFGHGQVAHALTHSSAIIDIALATSFAICVGSRI